MNWINRAIRGTRTSSLLGLNINFRIQQAAWRVCLATTLLMATEAAAQPFPLHTTTTMTAGSFGASDDSLKADVFPSAMANPIKTVAPKTNFVVEQKTIVQPRRSERSFAVLATISAAMMVGDVELSVNCLRTVANCREANPLMGSDPSRARLYGISAPTYIGAMLMSRMFRRKYAESKLWTLPLLSFTGIHSAGIASSFAFR
jgi:hypothetical protein